MADYEQSVFISYAWGTEREDIVNEIDETLQQRGIRIVRDKRALGYRGSIRDFMERIGRGSCIIVVISDKYLRSPNCMFELVEIADNKQFHDRIFPVILTDANIYDPLKRIEYIKFWEGKRKELAKAMKTLDPANLHGIREEMDEYDRIRDKISGITSILKDMNTLTPDMHRDSEFSNLYDAIIERLKENANDVTTEFNELARKAEAEHKAKEEAERVAAQKAEKERIEREKAEQEQLALAKAEADRKAKEEVERLAKQKAEEDRIERERAEQERLARAKAEAERKAEADRLAAQKAEEERLAKAKEDREAKAEADRLAAQKAERERIEREKAEQERLVLAKAEADRKTKEEAERKAKEEANHIAAQKAEADRLAKQKAAEERLAQAQAEAEQLAKQKSQKEGPAKEILQAAAQPSKPVSVAQKTEATSVPSRKKSRLSLVFGTIGVVVVGVVIIAVAVLSMSKRNIPNTGSPTENGPGNIVADASLNEPSQEELVAPTPTIVKVLPTPFDSLGMLLNSSEAGKIIENDEAQNIAAIAHEQHTEDEYNSFLDNSQPIPVTLTNPGPILRRHGWCATTRDILDDNLAYIKITLKFDNKVVPESKLVEENWTDEDGWECFRKSFVIDNWIAGEHTMHGQLTITQALNDGQDDYEPGTFESDFIVTVETTDAQPATP